METKKSISTKTKWVATSGWRGYVQPINAVAGANNTGDYDDSPCPSSVCKAEIDAFTKMLKKEGIAYRTMSCSTSNVFCSARFVLVAPEDREKALELAEAHIDSTRLFYTCD